MYEYEAKITDVYDGDTVTADIILKRFSIDLGFFFHISFKIKLKKQKLRLSGINAPEIRGEQRPDGLISRVRLRERILNKDVRIKTLKDKKGKYGRYIAEVICDGDNINDWLVTEGLAEYKKY